MPTRPSVEYHPRMLIDIYKLALSGASRSKIGPAIGVDKRTFRKWVERHPEIHDAVKRGYGIETNDTKFANARLSFKDYCLTLLPPELVPLWKKLAEMEEKDSAEQRFDMLMADKGKRVKQQIFLHSLISTNFNKFAAMRRAGIGPNDVLKWKKRDPDFMDLVNQVHEMKKDFIEGALMGLIAGGDSSATVFAAKTQLRDRGYGDHKTIEHKGETQSKQKVLGKVIHQLDVSGKRKLRKALHRAQQVKALPPRVVQSEDVT